MDTVGDTDTELVTEKPTVGLELREPVTDIEFDIVGDTVTVTVSVDVMELAGEPLPDTDMVFDTVGETVTEADSDGETLIVLLTVAVQEFVLVSVSLAVKDGLTLLVTDTVLV